MGLDNRSVLICIIVFVSLVTGAAPMAKSGCNSTCGDLTIPYPFGMGVGCFKEGFEVECNLTASKAFVSNLTSNMEITNIPVYPAQLRFIAYIAHDCYSTAGVNYSTFVGSVDLGEPTPYTFSDTENIFVGTGCDTAAFIQGVGGHNYLGGCISVCNDKKGIVDGECSGAGCCQTPISKGLKQYYAPLRSFYNHSNCIDFNPCSFAFMVERKNYTFKVSDLANIDIYKKYPIVLDWSIGNQSCQEAKKSRLPESDGGYSCVSDNSECVDSTNGPGYNCKCLEGFDGNPYLPGGCKDIDECLYTCKGEVCTNTPGNYTCTCRPGFGGNAMDGCVPKERQPLLLKLVVDAIATLS